jgi:hypothetical protein
VFDHVTEVEHIRFAFQIMDLGERDDFRSGSLGSTVGNCPSKSGKWSDCQQAFPFRFRVK